MSGLYELYNADGNVLLDKILAYYLSGDLPDVMNLNREQLEMFVQSKGDKVVPACSNIA